MLLSSLFLSPTKAILSTLKLLQQLRNYFHIHGNISRAANGLFCSRDWPEPGSLSCWLPGAAVSWLVTSHSQKAAPVSCLLTENSLCPRIPHNTALSHSERKICLTRRLGRTPDTPGWHSPHCSVIILTANLYWPAMTTSKYKMNSM